MNTGREIHTSSFTYKDKVYPLNSAYQKEGWYEELLIRGLDLVDYMISRHNKVLINLLTFTFPSNYNIPDNSEYLTNVLRTLTRHFRIRERCECRVLWVRETGTINHRAHYHVLFLIDGNHYNSIWSIGIKAEQLWERQLRIYNGINQGLVDLSYPKSVMLERGDDTWSVVSDVIQYIAKIPTKSRPQNHMKLHGGINPIKQLNWRESHEPVLCHLC